MTNIVKWDAIKDQFTQGLVMGNGASIALSSQFNYASLYRAAKDGGFINAATQNVFSSFESEDFELVLRRLWQTTLVNKALAIDSGRVDEAYVEVRNALIATVHSIHPAYDDVKMHFTAMGSFLKGFETVASANYDLLIYWAAMWNNENGLGLWFKDAFNKGTFREDWEDIREPYRAEGSTLFFYPHGNLCLGTEADGTEVKINAGLENLLQSITEKWQEGNVAPLFVSEGSSSQKLNAIRRSNYLSRVHIEVIGSLGESVAFYGLGFWSQDEHLIQRATKGASRAAVAIYREDKKLMDRAARALETAGVKTVIFFDAESTGAWIY